MPAAAWVVSGGSVIRLQEDRSVLEKALEGWVQERPDLVLDGVTWVARQLIFPDRSRLDLLGLTREDEWVVAELKRGMVSRSTLGQALHYAIYIGSMLPEQFLGVLENNWYFQSIGNEGQALARQLLAEETEEPRRVSLLLIGTGQTPTLELGTRFLTQTGFQTPVRVVTFDLFVTEAKETILMREVEEVVAEDPAPSASRTVSAVRERAGRFGIGTAFDTYVEMAKRLGFPVKPFVRAVTITAWKRGNPTLLYLRPEEGALHVWPTADNLRSHLGFNEADVQQLGQGGDLSESAALAMAQTFEGLVEKIRAQEAVETSSDTALGALLKGEEPGEADKAAEPFE